MVKLYDNEDNVCGISYNGEMGLYYLQSRYYDAEVGRFINGDYTYYLVSDKYHSFFGYCFNCPTNICDFLGTSTFLLCVAALQILLIGYSAWILISITSDPTFQRALTDAIYEVGSSIKAISDDLVAAIDKAVSKAMQRTQNTKCEKHHIVAKCDPMAKLSSELLGHEDVKISVNDRVNLVSIKYNLHKHIHNTLYHIAVYAMLKSVEGSREKTISALNLIKEALLAASDLCP